MDRELTMDEVLKAGAASEKASKEFLESLDMTELDRKATLVVMMSLMASIESSPTILLIKMATHERFPTILCAALGANIRVIQSGAESMGMKV